MTVRLTWRVLALAIAALCITIFAAANAHLVYVALSSQPDCVAHQKGSGGGFQAAKSSC